MPRPDYIVHHEHSQPYINLRDFIQGYFRAKGWGDVPPIGQRRNSVFPEVNHGRWIVNCPNLCGGAIVVSNTERIFLCPECGSPENEDNWYNVAYPAQKERIERALLRRNARNPHNAPTRNWKPGESIDDLERENRARGIG